MRISRLNRLIAGLCLIAGLAACEGGPNALSFLEGTVPDDDGPPAIRETVLAETVKISAPDGYCVDTGSRRNGLGGNFVVLAPCAALKVPGIEWPETVALITVSATRGALPAASAEELEAFVTSEEGRSLLATSTGDAVDVLQTQSSQGAFFVQVSETEAPVTALEATYWRGLIAAGGRLVSLTVRGYEAEPLSAQTGLRVIRDLAASIRRDSRPATVEAQPTPATSRAGPLAVLFPKEE
ncbi:MAG: hypothetical protein AAGK92_02400 [Pseudomonadota bacterium]